MGRRSFLGCGYAGVGYAMSGNGAPREIWMDHDGGWEDIVALLILLRSQDIRVMGVTVTPGIADAATAVRRVQMLLEDLKERDVRIVNEIPAKADVLATGPLTRVAALIGGGKAPAQVTWMGGALEVAGNVKGTFEWNAQADARALRVVLESGVPLTICPLDLTNRFPASAAVVDERERPLLRLIAKAYKEPDRYWWDELAAGYLAAPGLYKVEERRVVWGAGGGTLLSSRGRAVRVLTRCDASGFQALLRNALRY